MDNHTLTGIHDYNQRVTKQNKQEHGKDIYREVKGYKEKEGVKRVGDHRVGNQKHSLSNNTQQPHYPKIQKG